jgi:hypothetical protein
VKNVMPYSEDHSVIWHGGVQSDEIHVPERTREPRRPRRGVGGTRADRSGDVVIETSNTSYRRSGAVAPAFSAPPWSRLNGRAMALSAITI